MSTATATDTSWLRELAAVSDPPSPAVDYPAVLRRAADELEQLRREVEAWRVIGEVIKVHAPTKTLGSLAEVVQSYVLAATSTDRPGPVRPNPQKDERRSEGSTT